MQPTENVLKISLVYETITKCHTPGPFRTTLLNLASYKHLLSALPFTQLFSFQSHIRCRLRDINIRILLTVLERKRKYVWKWTLNFKHDESDLIYSNLFEIWRILQTSGENYFTKFALFYYARIEQLISRKGPLISRIIFLVLCVLLSLIGYEKLQNIPRPAPRQVVFPRRKDNRGKKDLIRKRDD